MPIAAIYCEWHVHRHTMAKDGSMRNPFWLASWSLLLFSCSNREQPEKSSIHATKMTLPDYSRQNDAVLRTAKRPVVYDCTVEMRYGDRGNLWVSREISIPDRLQSLDAGWELPWNKTPDTGAGDYIELKGHWNFEGNSEQESIEQGPFFLEWNFFPNFGPKKNHPIITYETPTGKPILLKSEWDAGKNGPVIVRSWVRWGDIVRNLRVYKKIKVI